MAENDWWKDLKDRLKIFPFIGLLILAHCALVTFAVIAFWAVEEYVFKRFGLSGIERWEVFTFRIFLAVSMLVIIGIYLYREIRDMLK